MDITNKDGVVTPEEQIAEQEIVKAGEAKVEEVRANVIAEYGFNEVDDAERIDKLVAKEVDNRKKLSQAIGQKIKHRDAANELRSKVVVPPIKEVAKGYDPDEVGKVVDGKLNDILEKRDLASLDYPDEVKKEISDYAKFKGISVKQASKASHIVPMIEQFEKDQKNTEASVSRTNRNGGKQVYDLDNPPDVDMATPEGRAKWDSWKAEQIKKGH